MAIAIAKQSQLKIIVREALRPGWLIAKRTRQFGVATLSMIRFRLGVEYVKHSHQVIQMIRGTMIDAVAITKISHDDALAEFLWQIRFVVPR